MKEREKAMEAAEFFDLIDGELVVVGCAECKRESVGMPRWSCPRCGSIDISIELYAEEAK